ncbi:uncharacterized protein [Coffea arabica]|uniref:SWIM-type domain-containing protein n=1 Tax=Coffea arabica TaxID=13443 RepID=A0ABM4U1D0_COFAR
MDNPKLELKMYFSTIKECKLAITNYSVRQGRPCKFVKQDLVRLRAKCRNKGCNWQIYAKKLSGEGSVQIRTFEDIHNCGFTYENPLVNSGWVGRKYCEEFRSNPKVDMEHFRKTVMKENKCSFSKKQTYRARKKALDIIHGSESDQYSKLGAYMHEIQKSNPGSSIILKTVDGTPKGQQRFQRLYMCFHGVKQGFLGGCRPLIGVDGTFLKGTVGGILLIAVGLDANNSIFPVAYAAVEGENKESWTWFFNLLKEDLKIERDYEWTIMSDKQKGLIQACSNVFPNAAHRFCVKHLHNNFSTSGFKGEALRRALWAAAKATTPAEFGRKMEDMAAIDLDAAKWFDDKPPCQWSRAYFSTHSKCDVLLNNICECFNSKILDAREKPIIEMLEILRLYMMQRMQQNRDIVRQKWKESLYFPRIIEIVQKRMDKATQCFPFKSNDDLYEVSNSYGDHYAVNIKEHTCSCRRWELTGIPCPHAIAALWLAKKDPMLYLSNWYTVETYLKCYEGAICPMNGEGNWEKTDVDGPKPPLYGKTAGRPKKQRRRTADEDQQEKEKKAKKMSRVGQVIRCKYCLQKGHNVRSCKLKKAENNASGSGIQSNEAANNARSDEVDSGDCNEANCTEVLVTCTPQIFDKNPNNKSAKRTKRPHAKSRIQDGSMHDATEFANSTGTNHLEDVPITSSVPASPNLYEVFGLKRSQVKYSQPLHSRKEQEKVQMPVKAKSVHMEVAAAATAATKRVAGSSRMKGKNKLL